MKEEIIRSLLEGLNGKENTPDRARMVTRLLTNHGYHQEEDFLGYWVYSDGNYRVYYTASPGGNIQSHMEVC